MPAPTFSTSTLANGMRIFLRPAHDAPLASFWIFYRVGSRNELPGRTGLSHWVEHMQFKGTANRAKGSIFRDVSRHGGTLNALTSRDWTAYYETLPSAQLDLAIKIESDRMRGSIFDPEETESERTVILSERQGSENNPGFLLYEEMLGAVYRAHPYRHMVIGHETDLRSISRDDLYNHYQQAYVPANAFIVVAGDFDPDTLLEKLERAFGGIPSGEPLPPLAAREPEQRAERRITMRRPAPTSYLRISWHTPEARHPDSLPLLALDTILSGAGGMGKSARLYKALVASGLARSAGSDFDLSLDPGTFSVGVTAFPGSDPDQIEEIVRQELQRVIDKPVSADELERALKQFTAAYVYGMEGVTQQAAVLGRMEIVDHAGRADEVMRDIMNVTSEDLQRVATTYLVDHHRTIGWLHPDQPGGGNGPIIHPSPFCPTEFAFSGGQRRPFERAVLKNGMVVLGQAQPDDPAVSVRIRIGTGAIHDPADRFGRASATGRMMMRGTERRSAEEINELTDSLGASIGVDANRLSTEVGIRCLSADLPVMLDLAAEVVRTPSFPVAELEKVRAQMLTGIREQESDTRASSDRLLRETIYPVGHPYHHRATGTPESVDAMTREDLVRNHQDNFGPRIVTVSAAGGFASMRSLVDMVTERFGDWSGPAEPTPGIAKPAPPDAAIRSEVSIPGKSQADLVIGFPTLPRRHPDFESFDLGNLVLGRLGLMGRLGAKVRDEMGLAYYVYSGLESGREGSMWVSRAGVDPSNIDRAIDGIIASAREICAEGITDGELADAKSYLIGSTPLALELNDGIAGLLQTIEFYDLGLDFIDRYPSIIQGITAESVRHALKTHLDPDRVIVAIARPS